MADRPILFSAPMIQALLASRKTQTRRVLTAARVFATPECKASTLHGADLARALQGAAEFRRIDGNGWTWEADAFEWQMPATRTRWSARLGYAPGDRLWVRETWSHTGQGVFEIAQARLVGRDGVIYAADKNPHAPHAQFWPSIHMPREFSRLTLIVTDVRVERLQDISWADALAEGVEMESADPPFYYVPGIHPHSLTAVGVEEPGGRHAERSFEKLWDLINAKRGLGWAANPWVCAVTFTVHRRNIDSMEAAGA